MPASVTQGGNTSTWSYSPEHDRYKMVSPGRTTWFLNPSVHQGGHYERTLYTSGSTEHRHTLYGGGRAIGEVLTFSGTTPSQTRYFHSDQQGSIVAVTDQTGTVINRYRYDPWGKQTVVLGTNIGIAQTRQGHTAHEMLDNGLTHMNGRLYDPVLSRFVSADPHVDNPFDLQSLNRYSYVNNNPLGFTDPSGYFKIFGKKWSSIRDKVVKPVAVIAVAWYVGPIAYNTGFWGVGGAALTAGAGATTASFIGAVAGGALAGAATGAVAGGLYGGWDGALQGAKFGAIGGAITGPLGEFYGNKPWGVERIAVNSLGGGVTSVAQGGSFSDGFRSSLLNSSVSFAWEYTKGYTDALKLKAAQNFPGLERLVYKHGELLTDGARSCVGSDAQCAGLFDKLVMSREGYGTHWYDENSFVGRFVNWTSKTHDFMNSWNYDQQTGGWFGRGVAFNSFYDATSFAGMLPAAVFTGYAKSLEMAPTAVDAIRRNGRY